MLVQQSAVTSSSAQFGSKNSQTTSHYVWDKLGVPQPTQPIFVTGHLDTPVAYLNDFSQEKSPIFIRVFPNQDLPTAKFDVPALQQQFITEAKVKLAEAGYDQPVQKSYTEYDPETNEPKWTWVGLYFAPPKS